MRILNFIINFIQSLITKTPPVVPVDPTPTPVPVPTPEPAPSVDPLVQKIFDLINQQRVSHGVHALKFDDNVQDAATKYAKLMANRNRLSHTLDSDIGDRITREGYQWRTCGENIAWNYDSAESVVNGWMNSSGHRRNILNDAFKDTGIAVADNGSGPYYCQDFAAH